MQFLTEFIHGLVSVAVTGAAVVVGVLLLHAISQCARRFYSKWRRGYNERRRWR